MNIVQLQYKLRDLPLSAVQAAANGRDPDIPEMLATMELNRRERMEQAASKPPTKSIKEQLEDKLSAQPREQMGIPSVMAQAQQANGEPQQDQVQQPGQQAPKMGGVAGLPTSGMFKQFNSGGIVAFAGGDLVEGENQSAAEVARLKQAEEMAAARELLELTGGSRSMAPAQQAPQALALPADVQRANETVMQAPFVQQAAQDLQTLRTSGRVTTPEEEMDKRMALLEKYGIRPPKEDELARIEKSNKAYAEDVAKREGLQGGKILAAAARPNVYGRYMPGTMGEAATTFGLANLDADRAFREANEKAEVAAKEAQRAFKMDNLADALTQSRKSEEYERDKTKAVATAAAQMASHGMSAQAAIMSRDEEKRYHDMWKDIQDKELKIKAAQAAATARSNIPELFRNIEEFEKKYPDIAKNLDSNQKIELGADILRIRNGVASRAEEAYKNEVIRVDQAREKAREARGAKTLEQNLAFARMSAKPDPEKIKNLENALAEIDRKVAEAHKYPERPKSGLLSLLGTAVTPAVQQNVPVANAPKTGNQRVYVDNNGKVIQAPAP